MVVSIVVVAAMLPRMCRQIDSIDVTDYRLKCVLVASRLFKTEFGSWPSSLADLTNNAKGIVFIEWGNRGPVDPWGNKIIYLPFNQEAGCGLTVSWGADGKPGGVKQDRDRIVKIE